MIPSRYLLSDTLAPGRTLAPLDDRPERLYAHGSAGADLLADSATARDASLDTIWNGYRVIADYLASDVMAGFEAPPDPLGSAVRHAVWARALYGVGVVMAFADGHVIPVSPRFWWPVLQGGRRVGQAVIVPFKSNVDGDPQTHPLPDRALVVQAPDPGPGPAVSTIYAIAPYDGITLGRIGWVPIDTAPPRLASFGNGTADFPVAEPIITEINEILTIGTSILRRFARPHLQVPVSAVEYDSNGRPRVPIARDGTIFPVQRDEAEVRYITLSMDTGLYEYQIRTLLSLLSSVVAVPINAFNVFPLARMESAAAVQTLAAPANEKVLAWQSEVRAALATIGVGLTSRGEPASVPASETTIT